MNRRFASAALSFCIVGMLLNATNIARVATRTTPSYLKPVQQPVIDFAIRVEKYLGVGVVRSSATRLRNTLDSSHENKTVSLDGAESYLFAGDSVMESIADKISQIVIADGGVATTHVEEGSTAGNPLWAWEETLAVQVRQAKADVVVLLLDIDAQTPEEYAAEAVALARVAFSNGAKSVVWVEKPVTNLRSYELHRPAIHEALLDAARREPRLVVLDGSEALIGPLGAFGSYVVDENGKRIRVREPDGVHLTANGAQLFADLIWSELHRS